MSEDPPAPTLRLTYTKLSGLTPPRQGSVLRFGNEGQDGRSFRVVNDPEVDEDGTFTFEVEPVDD